MRLDIGLEVVAAIVEQTGQLELLYEQMKQDLSKVKIAEVMDTRPLKNARFRSKSRRVWILTTGIY